MYYIVNKWRAGRLAELDFVLPTSYFVSLAERQTAHLWIVKIPLIFIDKWAVEMLDCGMAEPLLSVVIPVYNAAAFVPRCLESLLGQTWQNLEIICVDDGSTDHSWEVLRSYAARDSRVKVLHQENAGVSAARNRGIDAATGELITFVDADDWLELNAYERILPCMEDGVDLVCFGGKVDGNVAPELLSDLAEYGRVKYQAGHVARECMLRTDVYVWNKIFRRSKIEAEGIRFPTGIACGEDAAFYFCYAVVAGRAYYVQEYLYHYMQQAESAMARFRRRSPKGLDHVRLMAYVYDFYREKGMMSLMQGVYDRLFAIFCYQALETTPVEMHAEVRSLAYALAKKSGAIANLQLWQIRELCSSQISPLERIFHWFTDNRECYGLCGKALCSITYEETQAVYRVLGRVWKVVLHRT